MKIKDAFSLLTEGQKENGSVLRNRLMIAISVVLAILFLFLAIHKLDWRVFFSSLKNVQYAFLPVFFLWITASYLLRALRLRILLSVERKFTFSFVFWGNMAGYLGNNILPARAGELVRAAYLGRQNNVGVSFSLAVGLVERLMDLITLTIIGSLALLSAGIVSPIFQNSLKVISAVGLSGLGAIILLPRYGNLVGGWTRVLPVLKEKQKIKLESLLYQFLGGLRSLHSFPRAAQFLVLTGFIWFVDALGCVLLSEILHIPLLLHQAFVLLAALGIASAIPSTPGYLGVYQFVAVTTLASFGISQADALAYILIMQILGFLVVGFWGLLSLMRFRITRP